MPVDVFTRRHGCLGVRLGSKDGMCFLLARGPGVAVSRKILAMSARHFRLSGVDGCALSTGTTSVSSSRKVRGVDCLLGKGITCVTASGTGRRIALCSLSNGRLPARVLRGSEDKLAVSLSGCRAKICLLHVKDRAVRVMLP